MGIRADSGWPRCVARLAYIPSADVFRAQMEIAEVDDAATSSTTSLNDHDEPIDFHLNLLMFVF